MKKKILILSVALLAVLATGCKKVPKLDNGEEAVAKLNGKTITANELYSELKDQAGTSVLVNMIDEYITAKENIDETEAKEYANNYLSSIKSSYEQSGQDFAAALTSNGYADENAFKEAIKKDYIKNEIAKNYISTTIKDDEIEKHYKDEIFGEITARHILITPETKTDMTDEDKAKAEADALKEAQELIKKLDEGAKFEDLAKEKSDDKGTASVGGLMSDFKKSDVVSEFWTASANLKDGEYTKEPVKSTYGYHIILRVSQKEKPKLKDVKEDIIDTLVNKKFSDDTNLTSKSWAQIRKNYNLEIFETEIKNNYDSTISNLGNI